MRVTTKLPPYLFLSLFIIFFTWTIRPLHVLAGPPAPFTFTITQPDGTTFEARTWGDEHLNGTKTVNGYTVLQDPNNQYWFYAQVDNSTGQLKATDKIAGKDAPPTSARGARPVLVDAHSQVAGQGPVGVSSVPTLVVLVQFDDQPALSTEAEWNSTIFGPTNSVKDYYQEVSYNQLSLFPAVETCGATSNDGVTDWITLGTTHPNAGGPSIARAALKAADNCVNFATFDNNGDHQLTSSELVPIIIIAGYESSYGGTTALPPNVWGHQSSVNYKSLTDDVTIVPYAQFGEWHAATWDSPGHQATIGLIVHEVGHLLGWPDLYDTLPPGQPDSEGVGDWSVMGSGLWLGTLYLGDTPAHPSAWEKWYQNWLTPLQLEGINLNRTIPRVEDNQNNSVIQLLDNPDGVDWSFGDFSGTGEYFLVENRQKIGYDAELPGCGLLVWHVDESVTFNNWANGDENHKLVDLEEADGANHLDEMENRGDGGDPFPGSNNNITFNTASNPNSRLYDDSSSGISITNISLGCADMKSTTFTTVPAPDLNVSITPDPDPIKAMTSVITYTIAINNDGEGDATSVTITNTIPTSTVFVTGSASDNGAETTPGSKVISWPPTIIPAAATITRTFQVAVTEAITDGDRLANIVSISSAQGIKIENSEHVEIVGNRPIYLPFIMKND